MVYAGRAAHGAQHVAHLCNCARATSCRNRIAARARVSSSGQDTDLEGQVSHGFAQQHGNPKL